MRLEFLERGRFGWDPVWRNLEAGGPCDAVEHELAILIVPPIPMPMPAGESEPASAVRPLPRPSHVLDHALTRPHGRIAAVRAVGALARLVRRHRREHGHDSVHVLAETHVVVPFVFDSEGRHTARHRVVRQLLEFSLPGRIDRPVDFEVAADPVQETLALADRPLAPHNAGRPNRSLSA